MAFDAHRQHAPLDVRSLASDIASGQVHTRAAAAHAVQSHPSLTAEQNAAMAADPALAARFEELHADTLVNMASPFWGHESSGRYISYSRIFRHAEYTVGLDRRRAETAARATGRAA